MLDIIVIPTYKRFLHLLRKIDPPIEEVRQLHAIFIRGAEQLYSGFKIKMIGLEKMDQNIIRVADENIRNGMLEGYYL